ncbi:hypothetical protein M8013_08275 [Enterobacteriaceae bacterium H4N4]|uniref:Uncharacterized protein n=1 Tax=Silvania confinis TaxID=2926470 RepID=A0A9J6Q880_9ENTR|nr:DUF6790 family protein [Silvania confinis]MCU6668743.1 hypothetical protein [Silvania confinis]
MIANAIRLILTNIPLVMFILASLIPLLRHRQSGHYAERYLSWLLLLSIGVASLWAGLYHTLSPQTAAAFIGWQSSPFQFEMGMADIALGVVAIVSFWRGLEFKLAVVLWVAIEFAGLVYGHFHQLATTGDHQAGNAGILLGLTILHVVLLPLMWILARRAAGQRY